MNTTKEVARALTKAFVSEKNTKQQKSEFVLVLTGGKLIFCFCLFVSFF
jgi:6-phosphogluconolactonase/glucosamine-6-phosphate isomerase/deaminase